MRPVSFRSVTLRHLRLVSVLGKELNITRSAELLHSTQPALSRALAELEDLLDTRLFERTTKHITLTPSGLVLLQHANRILAEIDGAQQGLAGIRTGVHGELHVGMIPAISTALLAKAIDRVRAMFQALAVFVQSLGLTAMHEALLAGRLDVVFAPTELALDLELVKVDEVYVESTRTLAAATHPLAGLADVSEAQLAAHPWVLPAKDLPVRTRLNRLLAVHRPDGLPNARDIQVDSFLLAVELVRHCGMLCAMPSRLTRQVALADDIVELRVRGPLLQGPMCAIRLRQGPGNIAVEALVEAVRDLALYA